MLITINTNSVHVESWLEPVAGGWRGMHRLREYTRAGQLVRDETGPTGVVLAGLPPASLLARALSNIKASQPHKTND